MTVIVFISTAALSLLMIWFTYRFPFALRVFSFIAFLSLVTAGSILTVTIMKVLREKEVFMTTVHEVLLSPVFLLSLGYTGLYAVYLTGLCFIRSRTGKHPVD